jgi:hypothetical protein
MTEPNETDCNAADPLPVPPQPPDFANTLFDESLRARARGHHDVADCFDSAGLYVLAGYASVPPQPVPPRDARLRDLALEVVKWDWSDNDEDCVADMERLRRYLWDDAVPKGEPQPKGERDEPKGD